MATYMIRREQKRWPKAQERIDSLATPQVRSLRLSWLKHDNPAFGLTSILNRVCRNRLLYYGSTRPLLPCPCCDTGRVKAAQSAIHWVVDRRRGM